MKKIYNSFKFAIRGFWEVLVLEFNFRMMLAISLAVVFLMFYFPTTIIEKLILLIMIFSVLILELINSVIEKIMDFLQPQHDERVGLIKDLAAAIVLVSSAGALIVGLIIFIPYFLKYLKL